MTIYIECLALALIAVTALTTWLMTALLRFTDPDA
jgi:hypothetical protein